MCTTSTNKWPSCHQPSPTKSRLIDYDDDNVDNVEYEIDDDDTASWRLIDKLTRKESERKKINQCEKWKTIAWWDWKKDGLKMRNKGHRIEFQSEKKEMIQKKRGKRKNNSRCICWKENENIVFIIVGAYQIPSRFGIDKKINWIWTGERYLIWNWAIWKEQEKRGGKGTIKPKMEEPKVADRMFFYSLRKYQTQSEEI